MGDGPAGPACERGYRSRSGRADKAGALADVAPKAAGAGDERGCRTYGEGIVVDEVIFPTDNDEVDAHAADIQKAGAGYVRYCVSMPEDYFDKVQQGHEGDYDAKLIVQAWDTFRRSIAAQPRGTRIRCCLCPRSVKPRQFAFGLAVPYGVEEPEGGMMFGLCEKCAPDRTAAEASAQRAMEQVYPGMRPLGVPAQAGHA